MNINRNTIASGRPLEWSELWAAMDANPDAWIATTESMYMQMLEVVPPRRQTRTAFLVGEAKCHDKNGQAVHACFVEVGNDFYAKHMTIAEFDAMQTTGVPA